jgi:hypothetical protein
MTDEIIRIDTDERDKTRTVRFQILEGDGKRVLIAEYNPDQMARLMVETLMLYALAVPEPDNDTYALWPDLRVAEIPIAQEPIEKPQEGNTVSRSKRKDLKGSKEGRALAIDSSEDSKAFREAASSYIAENLPNSIEEFYLDFIDDVMRHAFNAVANDIEKRGLKRPSESDLNSALSQWTQIKRTRLGLPPQNRPRGSGDFRSPKDFLRALEDAFSKPSKEPPTKRELWHKLRNHKLYKGKSKAMPTPEEARTLMNWLERINIHSFDEAVGTFWKRLPNEE